jgi:hypothetical protein
MLGLSQRRTVWWTPLRRQYTVMVLELLWRGWSRQGSDNALWVAIPWPQDFIIGHGKKSCLCYDDLTVFEWTQGCLAIVEREEDMSVALGMLALLRATLRDAAYHGFESACYSLGCILSMMEDGRTTLHVLRSTAAPRSSPEGLKCPPGIQCRMLLTLLIGVFLPPKEVRLLSKVRTVRNFRAAQCCGCAYVHWNNGVCTQRTDHPNVEILWKHVCRRCLDPAHTDKDCPLASTGTDSSWIFCFLCQTIVRHQRRQCLWIQTLLTI